MIQIWKLSPTDMCELARNSVIQSGWESRIKKHWIGKNWYKPGVAGNDMQKTNVPNIRVHFRHETLMEELSALRRYSPSGECTQHPHDVSKHELVGAAGLTQGPQLQQNILQSRAENDTKDKEGEKEWSSPHVAPFPGVGVVAERAKQRTSQSE